mgnify:CR=1 FL=1
MVNEKSLKNFKRGAYLIDTARGKLCDRDAIASALQSGQLAGFGMTKLSFICNAFALPPALSCFPGIPRCNYLVRPQRRAPFGAEYCCNDLAEPATNLL